jgi:signal transduction histidine kinase/ActR/RegA family two-component response regulator
MAAFTTASSVFVLMLANTYLYYCYREKFIKIWAASWGVYVLRYLSLIVALSWKENYLTNTAYHLFIIASAVLLLHGTMQFIGKLPIKWPIITGGALALWTIGSLFQGLPLMFVTIPVFAFLALTYLYTGIQLLKHAQPGETASRVVGWLFILWGVHQTDYPLLRPIEWFAPWGFLIGSILALSIAIGMILIYFEKTQKTLRFSEERLVESNQILSGVLEYTYVKTVFMDPQFNYRWVNRAYADTCRHEPYFFPGKNLFDLYPHAENQAIFQDVVNTGKSFFTTAKPFEFPDQPERGVTYWDWSLMPLKNDGGNVTGLVYTLAEVTERIRAEEEKDKLEAQLQLAQKMESVGRLAGGIAHDFNNLLTVILGHAQLGIMKTDPSQPIFVNLEEIHKAGERSADLTRQLLAFARKQTVVTAVLDLNKTVTGMLNMLQRLIGEDIELTWMPAADLWPVNMDPSQIDQILVNLCVNARDAISGVGKITIETGNIVCNDSYCDHHSGFVPGEYVLLVVSDDGCGMDKETLGQIFEPFFTTKGIGEGTGLGLATVYGIVKQNNGFIYVYSETNHGTTFNIYLPRHDVASGLMHAEGAEVLAVGGPETILLVEDEQAILEMTTTMLKMQGYTVLPANTPDAAIHMAEEHNGEIHLLVTDVIMPRMNGHDLAEKLLPYYPDIKHLFMSGYTANVIAHNGMLEVGVNFIQKPFSMQDLATKLREVLNCGRQE